MKTAVVSTKKYDRRSFDAANRAHGYKEPDYPYKYVPEKDW